MRIPLALLLGLAVASPQPTGRPVPMEGGGEVSIHRDGGFIRVTIRGPRAGLASVCLGDDRRVRILHASAAAAEALYENDGGRWRLTSGFEWKLRASPRAGPGEADVRQFLAQTGWVANTSVAGHAERQFRIRSDDRIRFIGVTFLATGEPLAVSHWPASMNDDCRAIKVAQGFLPETADFRPATWHPIATLPSPDRGQERPVVVTFETEKGAFDIEVNAIRAPITAANFLAYVDGRFYDGGVVDRAVRADNTRRSDVAIQVIQLQIDRARRRETLPPIALERTNATGLTHADGAVSMARAGVDSATASFFICIGDQPALDFGGRRNADGQGFAVFGRVTRGMDVVRAIQASPTGPSGPYGTESLAPPITVLRAYRATPAAQTPAASQPTDPDAAVAAWRAKHEEDYRRNFATIAGLHDLKEGPNTAGSAATNDVVLPSTTPATIGRFVRTGGSVRFEPDPAATVVLRGQPVTAPIELRDDSSREVDELIIGDVRTVIHRSGENRTVRVRDPNGPQAKSFAGFAWFRIDPAWRVTGRFVRDAKPQRVKVLNTYGDADDYLSEGVVEFTLAGRTMRLRPFTTRPGRLFFVFRDASSGLETYETARFLYADLKDDGSVVLDFNMAYNPPCAFNPYTTCPIPLKENRLPVKILAGEKAYAGKAK